MKTLYDSDAFDRQSVGGISRYFAELIRTLRRLRLVRAIPSFLLTENQHLSEKWVFPVFSIPRGINWRYKSYYEKRINKLTSQWLIRLNIADVFHMTFYDVSLLPFVQCPLVTTVYDMIPELLPEHFANPTLIHPDKRAICSRADAIICISHNTKADLIRLFGIDASKVHVTHLGIRRDWASKMRRVLGLPDFYILFVGLRTAYKNFAPLIKSFARVNRQYPDLHLVCVGGGQLTESERETTKSYSITDRVHQISLSDAELAWCYSHAAAFVFPSLYEGFGLPILESFMSRCPAILCDRSCFPEIAADAAHYFDPDMPESLTESILRVMRDGQYRKKITERGLKRVEDFSWNKTAVETASIYRTLI